MSWLDRYFRSGVKQLIDGAGTTVPTGDALQFAGDVTLSHDPATGITTATVSTGTPVGQLFAALRAAVADTPPRTKLFLEGYSTPGDGGEGTFTVLSGGSYTDDGGTIACVGGLGATEAKCAKRDLSGARRDPRHFGAVCDGTTDDSAAYMLAVNSFGTAGGGKVLVPKGVSRVKLDLDGTLGTNLGNITFVGENRARPGYITGSTLKAITAAQNGGTDPGFVVRSAGQNIHFEDVGFDGDKRTPIVFHYDYQTVGSGLHRCTITRALEYAPITVTADSVTDTFHATGHGLVDGDQVLFRSTVATPAGMQQVVSGTYNWVWHVVNAAADTFQIERYVGEGPWNFTDNGSGTITVEKYGGTLLRIGGASGLQCDTGAVRDCMLIQDLTDFTKICGRALHISDANAERWDFTNVHFQNAIDLLWIKGGAASLRECTLFPLASYSRSHIVKEGKCGPLVVSDGTYSEMGAVALVVCMSPDTIDYHKPWTFENTSWQADGASLNWDCRQPLILSGELPGNVNITALGGQMVTALGTSVTSTYTNEPLFRGATERLVRIAHGDHNGARNELRRLTGPSAEGPNGRNGYGLFLGGGDPYDSSVRKAGPIVLDLGLLQSAGTGGNQTAEVIHAVRDAAVTAIESVNTAADKFKITGHALTLNDSVRLSTSNTLPVGFVSGVDYWVIPIDADWFSLARDKNGEVIPVDDAGTGTHSAFPLRAFLSIVRDSNDANYLKASRIDSVGPVQIYAPSAQFNVTDLSLGTSLLRTFDDTVETLGAALVWSATDNAAHTIPVYVPPANCIFGITVALEIEKTDHTTAVLVLAAAFKCVAGVVTQVGSTRTVFNEADAGAAAWALGLDTDGASVRVTYTLENNVSCRAQGEVRRRV